MVLPPPEQGPISHPRVILCEGSGDGAFFRHLIESRDLPPFDVIYPGDIPQQPGKPPEPGGRPGFSSRLRALKAQTGSGRIKGVLIFSDNDSSPSDSFEIIRQHIQESDWGPAPTKPLEAIRSTRGPALMVMMLPRTGVPGQLETLCLKSMRSGWRKVSECLDEFCKCTGTDSWPQGKQEKMRVRATIASVCLEDPNTSLTYAWSRPGVDLIPLKHHAFDDVARVLSSFDAAIGTV